MTGLKVLRTVGWNLWRPTCSRRPSSSTDTAHATKANEIVRSKRRLTVWVKDWTFLLVLVSWDLNRKTLNAPQQNLSLGWCPERQSRCHPPRIVTKTIKRSRSILLRVYNYDVETKLIQFSRWIGKIQCSYVVREYWSPELKNTLDSSVHYTCKLT